jgi:competence protein ComEC
MLLLAISIGFKKWNHSRANNIAFLNLRKHTGIVFKNQNEAIVITDLNDTDKTYRYLIQPYLDSCQVSTVHKVLPDSGIRLPFLLKENNLIQFRDKRILIFDKQLQSTELQQKLKTDYLYISGNPATNIDFINKYYDYRLMIIDNTNSNPLIASLQKQAISHHANYRILQRNKSVIIPSNLR